MLSLEDINCLLRTLSSDLKNVDLSLIRETKLERISRKQSENLQYRALCILCADFSISHPDWCLLSGRIMVAYLKSICAKTFSQATEDMKVIVDDDQYEFITNHQEELNKMVVEDRDWSFDIVAIATLMETYFATLIKNGEKIIQETPQYMYMRIAVYHHYPNLGKIKEMYDNLSMKNYSMSTPTVCNAGLKKSQLSACFLITVDDSMKGIAKSWHDSAIISKNMGGLGLDYSKLRHSEIGHSGKSRGIVPWAKIQETILSAVDQGGRRKGSATIYLPCWHIDIFNFIRLRDKDNSEDLRAMGLTYACWISDEFMRRVENNESWTLFCPNKFKNLNNVWGVEFEMLYRSYEEKIKSGKFKSGYKIISARELKQEIDKSRCKDSMPFILYKDNINRKSNQMNIGPVLLSNLCTEITEVTDKEIIIPETQEKSKMISSCILGSICFPSCVEGNKFNFEKLGYLTREMVINLNKVIDRNYYPSDIPEIKQTNLDTRPLGIGVQGIADVFSLLDLAWEDPEAKKLNLDISEVMYYNALYQSMLSAKEDGPYKYFEGSPASKGILQFDMWHSEKKSNELYKYREDGMYSEEEWSKLKVDIMKYGLRNSLLIALMPTASSAHIAGNNETIEPYTMVMFTRTLLSGQFLIHNRHLVRDLEKLNMWNNNTVREIIRNDGSIQNLTPPEDEEKLQRFNRLKEKYKTVFEIPTKTLVDMNIDRGQYICQSTSFNLWMKQPDVDKINQYDFYCWKNGMKTGQYYLRQTARNKPKNIALDSVKVKNEVNVEECLSCQS